MREKSRVPCRATSAYNAAMKCLVYMAAVLSLASAARACSFEYSPATISRYYRAEGWKLPGTEDFDPAATHIIGAPVLSVPGARTFRLPHSDPFVIDFPDQTFRLNDLPQRMHAMRVMVSIVRWEVRHHVVAYSYSMVPVSAHQEAGKWKVDAEAACIFNATFIDDKGDGVFRLLVSSRMTGEMIPTWAGRKEN